MLSKIFASFCLRLLLASLVLAPFFALGVPPTKAVYDPNNILRDDIFINKETMNQASIQSFLEQRGSCLAGANPADLGATESASWLIYDAAQNAAGQGINPQVILVTLQKEWSLISTSCAVLEQMYGTSHGTQAYLKKALGYNVPDVLGVGDCLYSFNAQLRGNTCNSSNYRGGPSSMRNSFNTNQVGPSGSHPFPNTFSVQEYSDRSGTITVAPKTKATSMLYRYTPYAYYGNYNFYNFFNTWFGNPACPINLQLVKGSGSPVFVLKDGVRYHINSYEALLAWGLECLAVTQIEDSTLNAYPQGSSITRVVKEADGPRVFVIANGAKRHIRTSLYVTQLGLDNESVSILPPDLYNVIPEGAPLGFLVKAQNSSDIFLAQLNQKYYVPDVDTIMAWGFPLSELIEVNKYYVDKLPTAGTMSVLVKGSGPNIYFASNKRLSYIPSLERVKDWKLENYTVTSIDDQFLESLPHLGALSQVTRGSGDPIYYIAKGKRYHLQSLATAIRYDQQYGPLVNVADNMISRIPFAGYLK